MVILYHAIMVKVNFINHFEYILLFTIFRMTMENLNKYKDPNNIYNELWNKYENITNPPTYYRNIIEICFNEFYEKAFSNDNGFALKLVNNLLNGDVYLLKKAFPSKYMKELKEKTAENWKYKKSEFYKIHENCPNFYRNITEDLADKYAFKQIKETQYFFPWNVDINNIYAETYKRWRVLKYISGYHKDIWEKNTPKDGVVDRIQIVKYPLNSGKLELHQDPYLYQKFFMSVYITKKGVDYKDGGMYFIDQNKKKFFLEDRVDIGDMSFGFGTIYHGVDVSSPINNETVNSINGRWFMGLYSTVSDYVNNRHTGNPARF